MQMTTETDEVIIALVAYVSSYLVTYVSFLKQSCNYLCSLSGGLCTRAFQTVATEQ